MMEFNRPAIYNLRSNTAMYFDPVVNPLVTTTEPSPMFYRMSLIG